MTERNSDTETPSYREDQGKRAKPDPRARQSDVPVAPPSAGVLGDQAVPHEWIDSDHQGEGDLREVY
jgi:hypothetical protein